MSRKRDLRSAETQAKRDDGLECSGAARPATSSRAGRASSRAGIAIVYLVANKVVAGRGIAWPTSGSPARPVREPNRDEIGRRTPPSCGRRSARVVALYLLAQPESRSWTNEVAEELVEGDLARPQGSHQLDHGRPLLHGRSRPCFFALMDRFWSYVTEQVNGI